MKKWIKIAVKKKLKLHVHKLNNIKIPFFLLIRSINKLMFELDVSDVI